MEIDRCAFNEGFVTFLRIFSSRITEKAGAECLSHFLGVATAGHDWVFVSFHDFYDLVPDIFRSPH